MEDPTKWGDVSVWCHIWVVANPKDSTQPTMASNSIYGVISRKYATDHIEIQQIINQLMVHDRRTGAPAQVRAYSMKR